MYPFFFVTLLHVVYSHFFSFVLPFTPSSFSFLTSMYCIDSLSFSTVILINMLWKFTHTAYPLFHPAHQNIHFLHSFFSSHTSQGFFPLFTLYSKFPFAVLFLTFLPPDTKQHLGISWELRFSHPLVQPPAAF